MCYILICIYLHNYAYNMYECHSPALLLYYILNKQILQDLLNCNIDTITSFEIKNQIF